jgi:hypothetical protein
LRQRIRDLPGVRRKRSLHLEQPDTGERVSKQICFAAGDAEQRRRAGLRERVANASVELIQRPTLICSRLR